ncbi:hypothetical protein RJ55_07334 [Drechmeria coniospora]|nr:hypothetical protein RJ55_07334 [Drechmeria coniospora]
MAGERSDTVDENSPEFWRNKKDNYLAAAKLKRGEIAKLSAEHEAAEKCALSAEKEGVAENNDTEITYQKYIAFSLFVQSPSPL